MTTAVLQEQTRALPVIQRTDITPNRTEHTQRAPRGTVATDTREPSNGTRDVMIF